MISEKDVRNIAGLARIHLREEEVPKFTKHLETILGYVNKLNKLETKDIEPTSHVFQLENVHRPDRVEPSLGQDQATSMAVETEKGAFKVPKVIE